MAILINCNVKVNFLLVNYYCHLDAIVAQTEIISGVEGGIIVMLPNRFFCPDCVGFFEIC
jgi:hypothetical protein